jgi:hypothetical protein
MVDARPMFPPGSPQCEGTVRRTAFAGKQEHADLIAPLLLLVRGERLGRPAEVLALHGKQASSLGRDERRATTGA